MTANNPFLAIQQLMTSVPDPIIFDVGAYDGQISLIFRELFPTAEIYAFEPFPDSFKQLWLNTVQDKNIHALNFGLSDRSGTFQFNANQMSVTNSLLKTDPEGAETWVADILDTVNVVEARFETIDSFMVQHDIPRIDFLKLDVQGAEYLVMDGASKACARGDIGLVYSEIICQPTYVKQKRLDEALSVFYRRGFDLYQIYNPSVTKHGRLRQIDAIFTLVDPKMRPSELPADNV
ncbi:MAG: FkbM family methyltransferase [Pyrinomonadaceae bacterium]